MKFWELPNVTQRHKASKCCCENGANKLPWLRVARDLQFIKNAVSVKHDKEKHDKMKYACLYFKKIGKTIIKEVKERMVISHQIENTVKDIEIIKKNQIKIL